MTYSRQLCWQAAARGSGVDAAIIDPAGYTTGHPALMAAIAQVRYPTIEVHISKPARRGSESEISRVSSGVVTSFGNRHFPHC
jgi:3-dehydroquinate dehydratase-2